MERPSAQSEWEAEQIGKRLQERFPWRVVTGELWDCVRVRVVDAASGEGVAFLFPFGADDDRMADHITRVIGDAQHIKFAKVGARMPIEDNEPHGPRDVFDRLLSRE